jgi:hypothetical protein
MGGVTVVAYLEPAAMGAIAAGVLIVVGLIYFRIRFSRQSKSEKEENPD